MELGGCITGQDIQTAMTEISMLSSTIKMNPKVVAQLDSIGITPFKFVKTFAPYIFVVTNSPKIAAGVSSVWAKRSITYLYRKG